MIRYTATLLAGILLLGGCSLKQGEERAHLFDLEHYPQNAAAYAGNINPEARLLAVEEAYEEHYFSVWDYKKPSLKLEEVMWPFEVYGREEMFGDNLRNIDAGWYEQVREAANFEAYGTLGRYAITLRFTAMRNFPTRKPLFLNPEEAGEGFPFDYAQNSGIHANEPLYVSHLSKDGAWAYVFTPYATGWVPAGSFAWLPEPYIREWRDARQLHIVKEHFPVKDTEGRFVYYGRIGMMLPLIGIETDHYKVLAVTAGAYNTPTYTTAIIPKDAGTETLLPFDAHTLPDVANELLGRHYGWGGMFEERDCSSMLRDFYAPFGIWLPRNSYQQSQVGQVISLEGLDGTEKLMRIKEQGIAFETLLYRKGHILLYLGTYDDQVMVMHSVWGVKTKKRDEEGRRIIGRSVISTLKLGDDLSDYDEEESLLKKLESMNIITALPEDKERGITP